MAITFVGAGTGVEGDGSANLIPGLPTGLQPGDFMLALLMVRHTSGTGMTTPAGWTLLSNHPHSVSTALRAFVFWRAYQTGDSAPTFTPTGSSTGWASLARIAAWRGVEPATPFGVALGWTDSASAADTDDIGPISGLITSLPGSTVVVGGIKLDDSTGTTDVVDTLSGDGLTWGEAFELEATIATNTLMAVGYASVPSSGTTVGSKTFLVDETTNHTNWAGFMLELRPMVLAATDALLVAEQPAVVLRQRLVAPAAADGLQITELQAVITQGQGGDRDVIADTDGLVVTEYHADVIRGGNIDAGTDSLQVTEYPASVSTARLVACGADSLSIAEQVSGVNRTRHVQPPAADVLGITEYAASLTVTIHGYQDALLIVEHQAGVQKQRHVQSLSPDALVITGRQAVISTGGSFVAEFDTLVLTEYQAGVKLSKYVLALTDALVLSEQPAVVRLTRAVPAGLDALLLTEQQATVVRPRSVQATADALLVTAHEAVISTGGIPLVVQATTDHLQITERPASFIFGWHMAHHKRVKHVPAEDRLIVVPQATGTGA